MATLELCNKYFETRDIYQLMGLKKDAQSKDIKKAYHKLSLLVHPDRVPEAQKEESTEKFKVLSKIYQVLTDGPKRALYDEQGIIDDDDDTKLTSWVEIWSKLFKPLTEQDISNYEKEYVNSELERTDIKKAYLSGKGCINHIMSHVPFMKVEDEPRISEIVHKMIAADEVPEYEIFTKEPASKRNKRHKKYARESKESKIIKERIERRKQQAAEEEAQASNGSLEQLILARKNARECSFGSLMDRLIEKYGDEDDSDVVDFSALDKKKKLKAKSKKARKPSNLNGIKKGRVEKQSGK